MNRRDKFSFHSKTFDRLGRRMLDADTFVTFDNRFTCFFADSTAVLKLLSDTRFFLSSFPSSDDLSSLERFDMASTKIYQCCTKVFKSCSALGQIEFVKGY